MHEDYVRITDTGHQEQVAEKRGSVFGVVLMPRSAIARRDEGQARDNARPAGAARGFGAPAWGSGRSPV